MIAWAKKSAPPEGNDCAIVVYDESDYQDLELEVWSAAERTWYSFGFKVCYNAKKWSPQNKNTLNG